MSSLRVVGVDVTARRWVAVVLDDDCFSDAVVTDRLGELVERLAAVRVVAVDIPIGLPVAAADWPRRADIEARERIGKRRSSVFLSPPRPVLYASNYADANALHREITGKGLSQQSWSLCERIREADTVAATHDAVIEVHPEVCFATLNDGPLAHAKKTWNGQHQRRRLLAAAGISIPEHLDSAGDVPADDLLDAAAAAWSARRFALGEAEALGEPTVDGSPNRHAGRIWV